MVKNIFFILIASLICFQTKAQKWVDMMHNQNINVNDVIEEAEEYFKNRDKGRGSGWKQFKRWEYEMRFHTDNLGNRINPKKTWEEHFKFKNQYQNKSDKSLIGNWTVLGPTNWDATSGWNPGVGRVTSIAVDPNDNDIIFVTSPGGGCWKTTDGGDTWSNNTDNLPVLEMYGVAIDPNDSNIIYIATAGGGVLKSTDGGDTWNEFDIPSSSRVHKVLVNPDNSDMVFATSNSGLYRSTNGGTSWVRVLNNYVEDIEFKPNNPSIVYASGDDFFKSTNSGASFTQITNGITGSDRSMIAVSPDDENYVYLVQSQGSEFGALFRSTDSGDSFTTQISQASSGLNFFGYSSNGTGNGGQAWYDMAICVSPTDVDEVHIAGIICWKSTDGGLNFDAKTEWFYPNSRGYNHADVHALEYVGSTIFSGSDGGIYKSTNQAEDWTDLSEGLGIRQFYAIGSSQTNEIMVSGGSQDNGTSVRTSEGWKDWLGADGMETIIDYTNEDIIYGTSQNGSLYKSTNGGASYFGLTEPSGNGNWVTPWIMDPTDPNTLYLGYEEIFKTTDGGNTWTSISSFGGSRHDELAIAQTNNQYIFASTGSTMRRTMDGGTNWTTLISGTYGRINYISIHPDDENIIAIATNSGVYKSTNAGNTWVEITDNLPNITPRCLIFEKGTHDGLYVGLNVGVYYINNNLSEWISFMEGLPNVRINELEIHLTSGKIRAATYGRGLWESPLYSENPAISLSGDLAFGDVEVGSNSAKTLTITNTGGSDLEVTSISYPLVFDGDWTSGTITAGNSQDVLVTFTPTGANDFGGTIMVNSNATSGTNIIEVSGRGIESVINLSGDLDFGDVEVNSSNSKMLTINNTGNIDLNITSITYPTGFRGNWDSGTIIAGGSQNVSVIFEPTTTGNFDGSIIVNSDATNGNNTIAVSGSVNVTSIDDVLGQSINIFPNPAQDNIYVEAKNTLSGKFKIKIIDLKGQEIKSFEFDKKQQEETYEITITDLPLGNYLFEISQGERRAIKRVSKK